VVVEGGVGQEGVAGSHVRGLGAELS
jgi:hypothetical protein